MILALFVKALVQKDTAKTRPSLASLGWSALAPGYLGRTSRPLS
ncbi:MAG: hypothetical protein R2751_11365 [Bacteroidales bacterium]